MWSFKEAIKNDKQQRVDVEALEGEQDIQKPLTLEEKV